MDVKISEREREFLDFFKDFAAICNEDFDVSSNNLDTTITSIIDRLTKHKTCLTPFFDDVSVYKIYDKKLYIYNILASEVYYFLQCGNYNFLEKNNYKVFLEIKASDLADFVQIVRKNSTAFNLQYRNVIVNVLKSMVDSSCNNFKIEKCSALDEIINYICSLYVKQSEVFSLTAKLPRIENASKMSKKELRFRVIAILYSLTHTLNSHHIYYENISKACNVICPKDSPNSKENLLPQCMNNDNLQDLVCSSPKNYKYIFPNFSNSLYLKRPATPLTAIADIVSVNGGFEAISAANINKMSNNGWANLTSTIVLAISLILNVICIVLMVYDLMLKNKTPNTFKM